LIGKLLRIFNIAYDRAEIGNRQMMTSIPIQKDLKKPVESKFSSFNPDRV
jgi:hypothetical protein